MNLSNNFTLDECEKSSTAMRLGIKNSVPAPMIPLVRHVALNIVQPVRDHYGVPIVFNGGLSWFRGPELNAALKGDEKSQHCRGEAVDLEVPGVDNKDLARWISENLVFDQLILEHYIEGQPRSGWVHVSLKMTGHNRGQILIYDGKSYTEVETL